jgi:hypothetical protein
VLLNCRFDLSGSAYSIRSHMLCESVSFLHRQNPDGLRTLGNTVSPVKWSHQACSRRYVQAYIQQDTPLLDDSNLDHKSHSIRDQGHRSYRDSQYIPARGSYTSALFCKALAPCQNSNPCPFSICSWCQDILAAV